MLIQKDQPVLSVDIPFQMTKTVQNQLDTTESKNSFSYEHQ